MARHRVGEYQVEVLHRQDKQTGKINVAVYVFLKGGYVEQVEFAFNGFNSMELRRRLPSLSGFPVQKLSAVIEDAREWPKDEDIMPRPITARANRKPKARRGSRGTG